MTEWMNVMDTRKDMPMNKETMIIACNAFVVTDRIACSTAEAREFFIAAANIAIAAGIVFA